MRRWRSSITTSDPERQYCEGRGVETLRTSQFVRVARTPVYLAQAAQTRGDQLHAVPLPEFPVAWRRWKSASAWVMAASSAVRKSAISAPLWAVILPAGPES